MYKLKVYKNTYDGIDKFVITFNANIRNLPLDVLNYKTKVYTYTMYNKLEVLNKIKELNTLYNFKDQDLEGDDGNFYMVGEWDGAWIDHIEDFIKAVEKYMKEGDI